MQEFSFNLQAETAEYVQTLFNHLLFLLANYLFLCSPHFIQRLVFSSYACTPHISVHTHTYIAFQTLIPHYYLPSFKLEDAPQR